MTLTPRFEEAFRFAFGLHATQVRKGSDAPYISHLLAVTSLVLEHGGREDEAIAALLHDAPEDQGGLPTLEEIRRKFGKEVAAIVEGCTDTFESPKPAWRPRKEAFVAGLQKGSESVARVVSADKLHNARSILAEHRVEGEAVWKRFRGGRDGTLWYYRAVLEALADRAPAALVAELDFTVRELERRSG